MSLRSTFSIAMKALRRHKLQTSLTMLGMTIGVAAVLTMIALGTGAEAAIESQVRAAGMNLIVVTAGNYKQKTEDDLGGVVDHQASLGTGDWGLGAGTQTTGQSSQQPQGTSPQSLAPSPHLVLAAFHPENDPMEKHDHPTASQRLGDLEAG